MPIELQIMISDEDVDRRVSTRRAAQRAQLEVSAEVGYGTKAISLALHKGRAGSTLVGYGRPKWSVISRQFLDHGVHNIC